MAYTKLIPRHSPTGRVEQISGLPSHYLLSIPAGKANQYRLAQLDDYTKLKRGRFPLRAPVRFSLSARVSSNSIPGTWGFGLWNDPFGLSLGFGGAPMRFPALPNAVWFFGASEESYLSFRDSRMERSEVQATGMPQSNSIFSNSDSTNHRASTTGSLKSAPPSAQHVIAANGFLAQSFRSPWFHPWLIPAGALLPFSRRRTRQLLGKVIQEDGIRLRVDTTQWHHYRLEWREEQVSFEVDDRLMFESQVSPNPPLGVVIWIDNQFAAFTPEGKIGFGVLENPEPAWLEIEDLNVNE